MSDRRTSWGFHDEHGDYSAGITGDRIVGQLRLLAETCVGFVDLGRIMQLMSILRKETTGGTLEENPRPMVTTRVEADATVSMMPSSERISSMLLICNDCRIVGGQSEVGLVLPFGPKVYLFKWEAHSRFGLFTFWCRMFHNLNLLCREGPFMSTHLPLFDEDPAALMYFDGKHNVDLFRRLENWVNPKT